MKKVLFTLAILAGMLFTSTATAQSNVYFNTETTGEGITVYQYNDLSEVEKTLFYIFTYGGGFTEQDQRWFVGNAEVLKNGDTAGKLYQTEGIFYPIGLPCGVPFQLCVGESILVGYFILRPNPEGEGYLLWVEPLVGDETEPKVELPFWDRLLESVHVFDTPLLNDVIVAPQVAPK